MGIKCYMIEESNEFHVTATAMWGACSGRGAGRTHVAERDVYIGEKREALVYFGKGLRNIPPMLSICTVCGSNGGRLVPDTLSVGSSFIRKDTGEMHRFAHQFSPGAMWYATWLEKYPAWDNQTGPPLCVMTPGGEWNIDSRAHNCSRPLDKLHRCWVRRGLAPDITVDKFGNTCDAGAGSILAGTWHGYLIAGELVPIGATR